MYCIHLSSLILSVSAYTIKSVFVTYKRFVSFTNNKNPTTPNTPSLYNNVQTMQSVRVTSQNTYTNTCMTSRSLPHRKVRWHKLAKFLQVFPSQNVVVILSLAAMMSLAALQCPLFSTVLSHPKRSLLLPQAGQHSPHRGTAQHLHRYRVHR